MSRFILHLAQVHETFRKPELEALAALFKIDLKFLHYNESSPFAIITLPSENDAATLVKRSIITKGIYEFWGSGTTYEELHCDIKARTKYLWQKYNKSSFRFDFECFQSFRTVKQRRSIIETFSYLDFDGPIKMKNSDEIFSIMEEYDLEPLQSSVDSSPTSQSNITKESTPVSVPQLEETPTHKLPRRLLFGRLIATGSRGTIDMYDLKKRSYIGTTSMDAELALITANLAHASPGKIVYDPFLGTGSFIVACSHFGAMTLGSDIDGRTIRGTKKGKSIGSNFEQYKMTSRLLDTFVSDLTNSPFRIRGSPSGDQFLDAIVGDPPYGVREGLKVLGVRDPKYPKEPAYMDGKLRHLEPDYIPPKRPYSFDAMLIDIMEFASLRLVPGGRLCLWLPTANENFSPVAIPSHPEMELVSVCVQVFNKWSRRLLTYSRLGNTLQRLDSETPVLTAENCQETGICNLASDLQLSSEEGGAQSSQKQRQTADDLNSFRKKYFQGFKSS